MLANSVGPANWLVKLTQNSNPGALVQAAVLAATTEISGLASILKGVQ